MSSSHRAVITGRGVLSPLGSDWPSFIAAIGAHRVAAAGPLPGALTDDPVLCHLLSEPEALSSGSGRAVEPLSALATAAVKAALVEAGIHANGAPLDDVGLVMSTALGPSTAVEGYLERLQARGAKAVSPSQFVDSLLSMPASRVSIALKLRGSAAVLGGASPFELALDWVRSGREHTVVAGGGEYLSPKCARYHRALVARSGADRPLLAQGAAFLVLEAAGRAGERGVAPLGELAGAGSASEPQEVAVPWSEDGEGRAFAIAMRAALADAGVEADSVHAVAIAAGDDASEACELAAVRSVFGARAASLRHLRVKRLLGEGLAAAGGFALLAALSATADGPIVVNAFEMGGAVTSLVVKVASP